MDDSYSSAFIPRHLGIIMDGNSRWAKAHNLPIFAGHFNGVKNITRIIKDCIALHIEIVTFFTFSIENWQRPNAEIDYLMKLASQFAKDEIPEMNTIGARMQLMGKRERIPPSVLAVLDQAVLQTEKNSTIIVNLAFNYGGRREIIDAIKVVLTDVRNGFLRGDEIDEKSITHHLYQPDCPDVDLVIRTSGENRLSNFLLWQAADTIYLSTPILWPDFKGKDLENLVAKYINLKTNQSSDY